MTIQIELAPEVEGRLVRDAEALGMSLTEYANALLREAGSASAEDGPGPMTPEKAEAFLRAMAEGGERLPVLPEEAFSRESFYQDHD